MFGRDNPPTSGIPGSGPTGLGGLPTGGISMAKPSGSPAPEVPGSPPRPWELGPWSMRIFLVVALAAATYGFNVDRNHRAHDPLDQASRGAITTNSSLSFTKASRIRSALNAVQKKSPSLVQIQSLNVSATELHGTALAKDGQESSFSVDASMKPTIYTTDSGSDDDGFPISKFPTGAAARILNAAQQKFQLDPANLTNLSFSGMQIAGELGNWNASYRRPFSHNSIQAAYDGTDVRLTGTPDAAARKQIRDAQTAADKQMRDAQKQITAARKQARKALAGLNR